MNPVAVLAAIGILAEQIEQLRQENAQLREALASRQFSTSHSDVPE